MTNQNSNAAGAGNVGLPAAQQPTGNKLPGEGEADRQQRLAHHDTATIGGQSMTQNDTQTVGDQMQETLGIPYMPGNGSPEAKLAVSGFEANERYGVQGTPIPCDEAWVAPINNFSKKDVRAEKWKLINYKAGTITFANTFDGCLRPNFKQDVATFPLNTKKARAQVAGHKKVDVNECPIAIPREAGEQAGIKPLRDETVVSGTGGQVAPVNQEDPARATEMAGSEK